ncbi:DUF933 domain-containing protein [Candidatus Micrarchaeota archaeon]|nr:DUF933 domain-containing protein [Candidatus Micrarchaeota archaeon]
MPHSIGTLEALGHPVFKVSADLELAKQKALEKGMAVEENGQLAPKTDNPALQKAIAKINFTPAGVQGLLNHVAFDVLKQIVLYPVEDETHYANNFGKVLPDAFLLTQGATALDLAGKIHTDLAKGFLYAVDAKTKRRLGKETPLKDGDVVKIVSTK